MLRYNNNILSGRLNLQSPVSSTFAIDVDTIGYTNTSSGYFFGTDGYSQNISGTSSNFGESLFDSELFDSNRTENSIQGSFDDQIFDNSLFDSVSIGNNFHGFISYSIIYDRYISDPEYLSIYSSLKTILNARGIILP